VAPEHVSWGLVEPGVLERIVVVSPHLDDAVLGAAHVLGSYPGTTVLTVFAGRPPAYPEVPTSWDAQGGFRAGDDVAALRRREDESALAVLGAAPVWLEFPDHQYLPREQRPQARDVASALVVALIAADPSAVFLPMGIANPDHVTTHEAGLLARAELTGAQRPSSGGPRGWFCYEDHGYKHIPGLLAWRIAALFRSGLWPTPAIVPVDPDMQSKRRAIERYRSQVPPLEREHALSERLEANVPEQYWRLDAPPPGWERLIDSV
jgi:LmbE family N-acetylglucosaminyl deacetylase